MRNVVLAIVVLVVVAGSATALAVYGLPSFQKKADKNEPAGVPISVELVRGKTLYVPEDVRKALGIDGTYRIKKLDRDRDGPVLVIPGTTALDPINVRRVKARFNAEVTKVEEIEVRDPQSDQTTKRELRPGDRVEAGKTILEVWSVEVGAKKSDLADAIVQLRLDEQRVKERFELWKNGLLPLDTLNQTRRDVVADQNNLDRAERTLKVWRVPQSEIDEVRDEAEKAFQRNGVRDRKKEEQWARSAIVAPISGVVVERNVGVGEYVADNTVNLFTIADVDRMLVMAYPSGDRLPELVDPKRKKLRWTIKTTGIEPMDSPIEEVSYILDPNQRTPVVKGYIPNPGRVLRAGQFVQAEIRLKAPADVVEVPLTALAEDGRQSFVFVQAAPDKHEYTMRRVQVVQRFDDKAYVRSKLTDEERKPLTKEEQALGLMPRQPLEPGDAILTSGVLELRAALEDLASKENEKGK
jgi:cobalt-zinc-cadmium efflux system membrane fusion protein